MKKVYIVQAHSGSYEDAIWWIHSIWEKPEDAEQAKLKLIDEMKIMSEQSDPIPDVDWEKITKEQYEIWEEWDNEKRMGDDFTGAEVKEYEVGVDIK